MYSVSKIVLVISKKNSHSKSERFWKQNTISVSLSFLIIMFHSMYVHHKYVRTSYEPKSYVHMTIELDIYWLGHKKQINKKQM